MMLTDLKVLVLTVAEIRAMAADKTPGIFWGVVSHTAAHFDELWSYFQLRYWGEHKHPGVSQASFICLIDHHNITWQELISLGLIPVGVGGAKDNPYDEHERVDAQGEPIYTCAAELVCCGYDPKDVEGHREYLNNPDLRGLDLLNRHKFFATLDPDPDVYIHAITRMTEYALFSDRNRVKDLHAAPTDIKDDWATWEDLAKNRLPLPSDLSMPSGMLIGSRTPMSFVSKKVVRNAMYQLWLYMTRHIAFARCLKRVVEDEKVEWRNIKVKGIKPLIRMAIITADNPMASHREITKVLRYLGADVIFKRSPEGHIFFSAQDSIWKYEDEEQMEPETDYREEKDLKRKRVQIKLKYRAVLIAFRRLEFKHYGDTTERSDKELGRNSMEGSIFSTPSLKAGYFLWGSTQAGQGTPGCPIDDDDLLDAVQENLEAEVVNTTERVPGTRGMSRRERMEEEAIVYDDRDKDGKLLRPSF